MPNYPAIPEPIEDIKLLTETVRALKECVQILTRQTGNFADSAATLKELEETAQSAASSAQSAIVAQSLDDKALDAIFDRASADAAKLVEGAKADATNALSEVQTALNNFLLGYTDENAVINVNIETLQSQVDDNSARITTEEITRATDDVALAGQISVVSAATAANGVAITDEAVARANADTAIGVRISNITATNTGVKTYVQSTPPIATAVGEYWIDTALNNTLKRWSGSAWVAVTGDIPIEVAIASTGTESIARVKDDEALSLRIDNLVSVAPDGNSASINGTSLTTATRTNALAQQITDVEAITNAGTANGFYRLTALSNPTDGAASEFAVNVKATSGSGYGEAGMRIQAFSNGTNRIKFSADQFIVTNSTANFVPFAITSGQLVSNALLDKAKVQGLGAIAGIDKLTSANVATYIETAAIDQAYIGQISAAKITVTDLSSIKSNLGTITAGYMQSPDGKMVIDLNNKTIIISD